MRNTRWWQVALTVAVIGWAAGEGLAGKPGGGGGGGTPGPAAIAYFQDGSLKTMAADGSGQIAVVSGAAAPLNAGCSWSPDGTRIAFQGNVQGDGIYVVNKNGTGLLRVHDTFATDPAWSPSTQNPKIAFKASRTDGSTGPDIWLVNPDGTGLQNLTNTAGRTESYPAWSPDGLRLAVRFNDAMSYAVAGLEIYDLAYGADGFAMIADVTTVVQDTVAPAAVGFQWLEWSPDGTRLAYADYDEAATQWDLWVLALADDPSPPLPLLPVRLTQTTNADEREPSWTPDGTALVFERFGRKGFRGTTGIHEINVATKVVTSRNASAGRFPNRSRVN